jgi:hypothetical protein
MIGVKPEKNSHSSLDPAALIGHGRILSFLEKAVRGGRLAHAYLFTGQEHVGKMAAARELASAVLGPEAPLDRHPDMLVVERGRDAKTGKLHADIVLEQIHELRGWLARGSLMGGWKVAVIDGAQYLNKEAANALLKNLEEPRERTLIILLTESSDSVFPTIRSRCQILTFGRVATAEIAEALAARGLTKRQAEIFSRLAGGCPGKALAYMRDPEAFRTMSARRELLLGLPEADVTGRWAILEKSVPAKLAFNEAVLRAGDTLDLLAELLRDALLAAYGRQDGISHVDVQERLAVWPARIGVRKIRAALQEIADAKRLLNENVNPRAVLESLALVF